MQAGREIKFRAWDTVQDKMLPVESINFRNDVISLDEGDNSVSDSSDMFILMQFTGLLDKNGKEIYEGDIIKGTTYLYGYELKNGRQFDYFGAVEWGAQADVGLCWFVSDKQGSWELRQTVHRNDIDYCTGEVIGNIYENPDLLPAI